MKQCHAFIKRNGLDEGLGVQCVASNHHRQRLFIGMRRCRANKAFKENRSWIAFGNGPIDENLLVVNGLILAELIPFLSPLQGLLSYPIYQGLRPWLYSLLPFGPVVEREGSSLSIISGAGCTDENQCNRWFKMFLIGLSRCLAMYSLFQDFKNHP